jgi:hypothetical protein
LQEARRIAVNIVAALRREVVVDRTEVAANLVVAVAAAFGLPAARNNFAAAAADN